MVSRTEDTVDFDKLETQLNDAVEYEARYWRENAAKFRAVEQKVATYEEFRDIVQASHLKPLDKGDKIQSVFKQPWNSSAAGKPKSSVSEKDARVAQTPLDHLPRTSNEFALKWRWLGVQVRYDLLTSLGPQRLADIFKCEISHGLLSDIIAVLLQNCNSSSSTDASEVIGLLTSLATAGRFQLALQFLSDTEKRSCVELFNRLQQLIEQSTDVDVVGVTEQLNATKLNYVT